MASSCRIVGNFGKRFVAQIRPSLSIRRGVHVSVYDKNIEEDHSSVVPDEVIPPQAEKYWAPHPHTGVFGPATDQKLPSGDTNDLAGMQSVLDQKAFFRSGEDLDKPAI